MSESFIKLPSILISSPEISPLELRLLAKLIFWSGVNKKENNHVKYGSEKLGAQIGIGRAACRRALLKLQSLQFINITQRGNIDNQSYGISNDIELTLERGVCFLKSGGFSKSAGYLSQNDSGNLSLNDSGNVNQKEPALDLNDSGVDLNDSGHIDDRDIIKLESNKITRACARTKAESGDVAPDLSKPIMNRQGSQCGENELDLEHYTLAQAFFDEFSNDLFKFQLVSIDKYLCLRPYKAFRDIFDNAFDKAAAWFEARGVVLQRLKWSQHYQNEIIITKKQ